MRHSQFNRYAAALVAGTCAFLSAMSVADERAAATPAQPPVAVAPSAPAMVPIGADQLAERLGKQDGTLFLLDVRSVEEFAEGHIAGAVNIPYDQVEARLAEVPKDKDVVLYCRSGRRAVIAADVLRSHRYPRLGHLEGDIQAWVAQGRPVARAGDSPPAP
jgi:rhodanese-related sulfurtransferase